MRRPQKYLATLLITTFIFGFHSLGFSADDDSLVVTDSGNVGIGTATPAAKLSFGDLRNYTESDGLTWFDPYPTAYGIYRTAGSWSNPNYQQLKISWLTGIILNPGTNYGKSYVDVQGNLVVTNGGKVGTGTTSPQQSLHVNGQIQSDSNLICAPNTNVPGDIWGGPYLTNQVGFIGHMGSYALHIVWNGYRTITAQLG